jgi:polysaccharide export outer membrane protein
MTMNPGTNAGREQSGMGREVIGRHLLVTAFAALGCVVLIAITGCQTPESYLAEGQVSSGAITLRAGDVLKIAFPGAPNLDTTQPIRRDGKIVLPMVGEVSATGLMPSDLQAEIIKLYASQLVSKEVTVTVVSSSFPVFVTGAVLRPGKILTDHTISALEAVMEAGGFDYTKANLRGVIVIRQETGGVKNYTLDLKKVLDGKESEPFYLQPSDIVYVPQKFSWF